MIRPAIYSDLEPLIYLGYEMHQESRFSELDYNVEKVAHLFTLAVDSEDYLFLVVEVDCRVVGGFIGYVSPHWFSDDLMAGDFALFVKKEFRGQRSSLKLAKQYAEWAKSKGVKPEFITAGISTGVNVQETEKLYSLCGFEKFGSIMSMGSV